MNLRPRDQAREPHAANGGRKPLRILDRAAHEAGSVGTHQLEAQHMPAEGPRHVVVLAVNVVGDRAAHRYIFRPRRHRQKEPARNRKIQNLLQRRARLAAQHARRGVEMQQPVHARGL